MTRNLYIFSGKLEVPKVYEYEFQQSLYATEYRNGRAIVDLGEDLSMSSLQMLREECIRGYLAPPTRCAASCSTPGTW